MRDLRLITRGEVPGRNGFKPGVVVVVVYEATDPISGNEFQNGMRTPHGKRFNCGTEPQVGDVARQWGFPLWVTTAGAPCSGVFPWTSKSES